MNWKYQYRYVKIFLFICSILLTYSVGAFDTTAIQQSHTYIYDETQALSSQDIHTISEKIQALRDTYSVEVLVVLLKNTGGEDISSVAVDIGQKLGVGKSDVDNGLVILVALEQREWFIATGYGLEGSIPDIIASRIGQLSFPQYFKNGGYGAGIMVALNQIEGYIKNDSSIVSKLQNDENSQTDTGFFFFYFFGVMFISSFLFYNDIKEKNANTYLKKLLLAYLVSLPIAYIIIGVTAFFINIFLWIFASFWTNAKHNSGGGFSSGGGGFSSGGGGFGGGSFGGGGAGGRW